MEITFVQGYVPTVITEHPVATLLGQLFDADMAGSMAIRAQVLLETATWGPGTAMRVSNGELYATVTATRDGVVFGGVLCQERVVLGRYADSIERPRVSWGTTTTFYGATEKREISPKEAIKLLLDHAESEVTQRNSLSAVTLYKITRLVGLCPGGWVRFVHPRLTHICLSSTHPEYGYFLKDVNGHRYRVPLWVDDIDAWITVNPDAYI